jgi:HTH-type transcriptional regulator / antitoxin HigA
VAKHSKKLVRTDTDASYLALVRAFPLRPIGSSVELDRAIGMIDSLISRPVLDPGEDDYLDVLSDLVHRYETEHDPIAPVSDAEMVRFLLESNDMTQAELAQRSKIAVSTISEVLAEKRKLSRRHIAAISLVFRVSPAIFFSDAIEMTSGQAAKIISRRTGIKVSNKVFVSLASAFALDSDRGCWRALQEMVAGERPGTPPALAAKRLNHWGDGGGDCWRPASFSLTGADITALAECFKSETECWRVFRELVEEAIPEMRSLQRGFAEEN